MGGLQLSHVSDEGFMFQRLLIAKEFGDKAAERRAYSNLGNAYIFLGEFETASEYYRLVGYLCGSMQSESLRSCKITVGFGGETRLLTRVGRA